MLKKWIKEFCPQFMLTRIKTVCFYIRLILFSIEQKKRRQKSIFDMDALTKELGLISKEYGYNAFYGHNIAIKNLLHLPLDVPVYGAIEHGINFYNNIDPVEVKPDVIYTMSDMRRTFLQENTLHKTIIAVGPYIQYVDTLYSDSKINKIKKELGKTLLIFPSHSSNDVKVDFNHNKFIEEINNIKIMYGYNTVIACIYWRDYLDGKAVDYQNEGYLLCTAGHAFDSAFLSRLKTIITISDFVMVNKIGTNLGYAISSNRPVYLYKVSGVRTYMDSGVTVSDDSLDYRKKMENEAIPLFGSYNEVISDKQIEFVKKYWGHW